MANIPVIDISDSNPNAAHQLLTAATDSGFAFIAANDATGLSAADIDGMFELSKDFFASPTTVKEECLINSANQGPNRGWTGMHGETLDPGVQKRGDFKEAFNYADLAPQQHLSGPLAPARPQLAEFQQKCHALCLRILDLFGKALSIQEDGWFAERHDLARGPTGSILRLLYYPAVEMPSSDADVRAGAHSDYGSVTLLFQRPGQPGLEIWAPSERWESVPVDPTSHAGSTPGTLPILLNIGDVLSYWTNGLLKSTIHRVVFPQPAPGVEIKDRYSMAYFCHPIHTTELEPVPSNLVQSMSGSAEAKTQLDKVKGLGGGKVLTAHDHLDARLRATYEPKPQAA